jgi:hypothetical protein
VLETKKFITGVSPVVSPVDGSSVVPEVVASLVESSLVGSPVELVVEAELSVSPALVVVVVSSPLVLLLASVAVDVSLLPVVEAAVSSELVPQPKEARRRMQKAVAFDVWSDRISILRVRGP